MAVVAVIAGAIIWATYGVVGAAKGASDKQNVAAWNTVYCNLIVADPSFSDYGWSDASSRLAAGVEVTSGGATMVFLAPLPDFTNADIPDTFEKGKGLKFNE